jgi:hypothetical protein
LIFVDDTRAGAVVVMQERHHSKEHDDPTGMLLVLQDLSKCSCHRPNPFVGTVIVIPVLSLETGAVKTLSLPYYQLNIFKKR